jgi:hypothetical protein
MATRRFLPFEIDKLTDEKLKDTVLVKGKLNEAVQAVEVRDTEIDRLAKVNVTLEKNAEQQTAQHSEQVQKLNKELALQAGQVQELKDKLDQATLNGPKIGVEELVSRFKTDVDRINADVISRKTPGMRIDSVEVEVRGGIDVSDGLKISQLPASALGAQSVSVLKFNLRPASTLKIVDDDETPPR